MNPLKSLIGRLAQTTLGWKVMSRTLLPLAECAKLARRPSSQTRVALPDQLQAEVAAGTVLNGPFAGLAYPSAVAVGSTLLPKIVGCYEAELHEVIEEIRTEHYASIVNIGCGEGYYAVGLARLFPEAAVYAFDTSETARNACQRMAQHNRVDDRVHVGGPCGPAELGSLPLGDRAVILFTPLVVEGLRDHDVLIETHDFLDIEISERLQQRFEATHTLRTLESVDDIRKAQTYRYPQLDGLPTREKWLAVREGRPAIMTWLWLRPRA